MKNKPIINSLLDIDDYKLTMGQFAWLYQPDAVVKYALINRSKDIPLAAMIAEDELREQLDYVRSLRFTEEEIEYLRSRELFGEEYLEFLKDLSLPSYQLSVVNDQFELEVEGLWPIAIFWETIILKIVMTLYNEAETKRLGLTTEAIWEEGLKRLCQKIDALALHPDIRIMEFATRRPYSGEWQEYALSVLLERIPNQILGTSNVHLARKFGIKPLGTSAHELPMVYAGIYGHTDEGLRDSVKKVMTDWWNLYGERLSIALTDTFGTKSFLADMTSEQVESWRGYRQDSMEPIEYGELLIGFLRSKGIDPKSKLLVPSDGLDLNKIIKIHLRFKDEINLAYGWGGGLMNDMGLKVPNVVMKAVLVNGRPLVKLSDVSGKHLGPLDQIDRYKRVFAY